jgi:hypothetical protein
MKKDAVNIVVVDNSIPDVALTLIAKDETDRNRIAEEAEDYFRNEMEHRGYTDEDIDVALENGHTCDGTWDIWITWTIVDVPELYRVATG